MHLIQIEWNVWWIIVVMPSIFQGAWFHLTSELMLTCFCFFFCPKYLIRGECKHVIFCLARLDQLYTFWYRSGEANPQFPYMLHLWIQVLIKLSLLLPLLCNKLLVAATLFISELFYATYSDFNLLIYCPAFAELWYKVSKDISRA